MSATATRRRGWLVATAAGAALITGGAALAAAISKEDSPVPTPATATQTEVQASSGTADVGQRGPEVTVAALGGEAVQLPADRPAVVFFFAGWCYTCLPEAQALGQLQDELGEDIAILAVDIDPSDTPQTIEDFMAAAGDPTYPVAHDLDGTLTQAFNVAALDTTVIIDAEGTVVFRDAAPTTADQLRQGLRLAGV